MKEFSILIIEDKDKLPVLGQSNGRFTSDTHDRITKADFAILVERHGAVTIVKDRYGVGHYLAEEISFAYSEGKL